MTPAGDPVQQGAGEDAESLRAMLAGHAPADAREAEALARFEHELRRLRRPFDRDADPVHVTASSIVVGARGTVLHRHLRLNRWLQPGGHIDAGESPQDAAVREGREETGLTLDHPPTGPFLLHVDVHPAALGHTHLDLRYLVLGPDQDPAPPSGESQDVAWFEWDAAEALADDALIGALRRAQAIAATHGRTSV